MSEDLDRLLEHEVVRRLAVFDQQPANTGDMRAALHSLRSSAALAGHTELAMILAQLGQRLAAHETGAVEKARRALVEVSKRLGAGLPPLAQAWPEPPAGLRVTPVEPRLRAEYVATLWGELAEIDLALSHKSDAMTALKRAYLAVHAMKSTASAAGDEVFAWYCHGLESRLKAAQSSEATAAEAMHQLARHRALCVLWFEDPERALETLHAAAEARLPSERPSPQTEPAAGPLRVPPGVVDRLSEKLERLEVFREEVSAAAELALQGAKRLRQIRALVIDALGVVMEAGGTPANSAALEQLERTAWQLRATGLNAERAARTLRRSARGMQAGANEMRGELHDLLTTNMASVFDHVASGVTRLAATTYKNAELVTAGGHLLIDQRLLEPLKLALTQVGLNALVHGIESLAERKQLSKPARGKISIKAESKGALLRILVEDDGRGVDAVKVRELLVARQVLSSEAVRRASEEELFSLLFVPGLSTQPQADLLGGRGMGLNVAREALSSVGGSVQLRPREPSGLVVIIEVPTTPQRTQVIWLEASGIQFALPTIFAKKVGLLATPSLAIALGRCLGLNPSGSERFGVELALDGVEPLTLSFDDLGRVETVSVRSIPTFATRVGPYSGAVLRRDSSLALVLDPALLAARAFASVA